MNKPGFTLLEVLLAGALLLVAITFFGYLLKTAENSAVRAGKLSRSLVEARGKMEALRKTAPTDEISVIYADVPPVRLYSLRSKD